MNNVIKVLLATIVLGAPLFSTSPASAGGHGQYGRGRNHGGWNRGPSDCSKGRECGYSRSDRRVHVIKIENNYRRGPAPRRMGQFRDNEQSGGKYGDDTQSGGKYNDDTQSGGKYNDDTQSGGKYNDDAQSGGKYGDDTQSDDDTQGGGKYGDEDQEDYGNVYDDKQDTSGQYGSPRRRR